LSLLPVLVLVELTFLFLFRIGGNLASKNCSMHSIATFFLGLCFCLWTSLSCDLLHLVCWTFAFFLFLSVSASLLALLLQDLVYLR
jgi:hypothetical protein